jgi:hypothetical protein
MGLTIHYKFRAAAKGREEARQLVERLRQRALDLPFLEVGPLMEFGGDDCDFNKQPPDDPNRWLLVQSSEILIRKPYHYRVTPSHVLAFETYPGEGCEPANFGLVRYPSNIEIEGQRVRTGMRGWRWRSFCKTQYASDPAVGGVANFLRCHLLVIGMLDHARDLGILAEVSDEGRYWQKRDAEALAQEVGEWNEMIAANVGKLKDLLSGGGVEAPITDYPDFEHLEAKGRDNERAA